MEYAVNHILSIVALVIRSGLNVLVTTVSLPERFTVSNQISF